MGTSKAAYFVNVIVCKCFVNERFKVSNAYSFNKKKMKISPQYLFIDFIVLLSFVIVA